MRGLRLLSPVLIAPLFVVSACGGGGAKPTLDQKHMESEIYDWAINKEGAISTVKVDCPADVEIKAGSTFHCLLSAGTEVVRLVVTIEDSTGYLTWVVG